MPRSPAFGARLRVGLHDRELGVVEPTRLAQDAVVPDAKFLRVAREIAATHHERWDGKGYPLGLAGEAIPLAGRIVALADVYDALTSKRCYKEPYIHSIARSIIIGDAGTHFDPDVVEAFIQKEAEFIAIHDRFREEREEERAPSASEKNVAKPQAAGV